MPTIAETEAEEIKRQFGVLPGVSRVTAYPSTVYTVWVTVADGDYDAMSAVRVLERKLLRSNCPLHLSAAMNNEEATDED